MEDLKKTRRIGRNNGQTQLWREVQAMGGLVSGGAVQITCAKEAPTGRGWTRRTGSNTGQMGKPALWWQTPHS